MTLRYSFGNEHSADNPFGRAELTVPPDGHLQLSSFWVGRKRSWTGTIDRELVARLHAALRASAFPATPREPWPAGSTGRILVVEAPEHELQSAHLEWHVGGQLPGYGELFAMLDSLMGQLSEGVEGRVPDTLGPVVADVRQVYDGAP